MRRADSLFARLFGVLLLAIVLAHALAFIWFHFYAHPQPPQRPRHTQAYRLGRLRRRLEAR